jgi:hypothetical protein
VRTAVRTRLEPLRVLTTRLVVAEPVRAPVAAELLVARRSDVSGADVAQAAAARLERFLDPVEGGPDGTGWPFGRDVFVSELFEQLEGMPEIDYVADILLSSACPPNADRCVPARELWHESGDFIGLELGPHHLPEAAIGPADIVSATTLVPLRISVVAKAETGAETAALKGAVKVAVRRFFRQGVGWPPLGAPPWDVGTDSIDPVVASVPGVGSVTSVDFEGDPARITRGQTLTYIRVYRDELVDADVDVDLELA